MSKSAADRGQRYIFQVRKTVNDHLLQLLQIEARMLLDVTLNEEVDSVRPSRGQIATMLFFDIFSCVEQG